MEKVAGGARVGEPELSAVARLLSDMTDPEFVGPLVGDVTNDFRHHILGQRLLRRLPEALAVEMRDVAIGDWRPELQRCAENTQTWVENNPGWQRIRGYQVIDGAHFPFVTFGVHNVVREPGGDLIDITPGEAKPFILHRGADEEHDLLLLGPGMVIASRYWHPADAKAVIRVGRQYQVAFTEARRLQVHLEQRDRPSVS